MGSRTVAPPGGIRVADRLVNLPLYRRALDAPIRHVLERVARGIPRAPVTSGCPLNRDLNVDNRTRPPQPAPPLLERGRKRPRRAAARDAGSAVGEVDGALLRALAADGRVGRGLDVVGRPLRAAAGGPPAPCPSGGGAWWPGPAPTGRPAGSGPRTDGRRASRRGAHGRAGR